MPLRIYVAGISIILLAGVFMLYTTLPWGGNKVLFTVEGITLSSSSPVVFSAFGANETGYQMPFKPTVASFSAPNARLYKESLFGKTPVIHEDDIRIEVGETYTGLLFYDEEGNIDGILPTSRALRLK